MLVALLSKHAEYSAQHTENETGHKTAANY
jgi:hypothetical protein